MKKQYVSRKILRTGKPETSRPILNWLDIELTERCNNNCIHCSINIPVRDLKKKGELGTDEWKKFLREAAELGCHTVRITGGEPLLRGDFPDIYRFIKKLGMKVLLFTNATLINDEIADMFSEFPPGTEIEITLYGMKKGSYESISGVKGSFKKAWDGIEILKKRNIPFVVKSVYLPSNKDEVGKFIDWSGSLPWMKGRNPQISIIFDMRNRRDSERKNKGISGLRPSPEKVAEFMESTGEAYPIEMKKIFSAPPAAGDKKLFTCGAGFGAGTIDPYGKFQPCILVRHPDTVYDLKHGSLREALLVFFPAVRERESKDEGFLSKCPACFIRPICEQCPGKSWNENGTLDSPVEYLCEITHARARGLGLLKDREKSWEVKDGKKRITIFTGNDAVKKKSLKK